MTMLTGFNLALKFAIAAGRAEGMTGEEIASALRLDANLIDPPAPQVTTPEPIKAKPSRKPKAATLAQAEAVMDETIPPAEPKTRHERKKAGLPFLEAVGRGEFPN